MDLDENKSGVYINLLPFYVNLFTVVVERCLKKFCTSRRGLHFFCE